MDAPLIRFLPPEIVASLASHVRAERGAVDVWACTLSGSDRAYQDCAHQLSPAELARAQRFFHERDRIAFVFSHGLLRQVLGAYCGVEGRALEFVANEYGKPALSVPSGMPPNPVSFNLSHSHGRALIAVSDGRAVGVDVEQEDARKDALSLAERYFFGAEIEAIRAAGEALRAATFFRFWAAKEAVIKAQGSGLSTPLDRFHVVFAPHLATAEVSSFDAARLDPDWFVRRLECGPGWHGAVCARGADWRARVIDEA
jgi:4'-phosphopantetheinyl transferase